jgi:hypothetical protein
VAECGELGRVRWRGAGMGTSAAAECGDLVVCELEW